MGLQNEITLLTGNNPKLCLSSKLSMLYQLKDCSLTERGSAFYLFTMFKSMIDNLFLTHSLSLITVSKPNEKFEAFLKT